MVMFTLKDFLGKIRHYFRFSKEEVEACVISTLILAFIVSFDQWGYGDAFEFKVGLWNYFWHIVVIGIIMFVQIVAIKLQALNWGFRAEYKMWWYGLIIGLGLAFLSASFTNGLGGVAVVWFLAPGGVFFHHLAAHRLGWFRYGVNLMETAMCCLVGSLAVVFVAIIFKIFSMFMFTEFFGRAMMIALWIAFFSMLPIPPLNGSRIFFWSRVAYPMFSFFVIGMLILLPLNINIFIVLLLAIVVGAAAWVLNLWKIEGTWW